VSTNSPEQYDVSYQRTFELGLNHQP